MKQHSLEKELKFLSISVIVIGIVLTVLAFLPVTLYTQILMGAIITFLIGNGISVMCRAKKR